MFRNRKKNKENKITERTLYASLFSMVLCCAMLLETTYAWFTQEINTGVAVIQTGEMSVELVVESGETYATVSADNSASLLQFKAYNAAAEEKAKALAGADMELTEYIKAKAAHVSEEDNSTYFEPGGTYYLPPIYVKNTGNIDLKYMVTVDFTLASTAPAGSAEATLAVTEGEDGSAQADLRDVISFMVSAGESNAVNMESLAGVPLTIEEGGTEGKNADGSASTIEETLAQVNAYQIYSGKLEAAGETESMSDPIIIQATMPKEITSGWADLKLSGIQIIVTATQITADDAELTPKGGE